jgi:hypothetical protein
MWTVATYQDTDAMIEPPLWRVALIDLMRGVNEREAAIDVTKTEFYKGDGTQGSDLEIADLAGLNLVGGDMKNNLLRIRDFIVDNVQYFTQSSGISEVWTLELLETEIGEEINYTPKRPLSARFWQTMQDALDLLVHARRTVSPDISEAIAYVRGYPIGIPSPSDPTPSGAWANLLGTGDTSLVFGDAYFHTQLQLGVRPEPGAPFTGYDAICTRLVESLKYSNAFVGVGTGLQYVIGVIANSTLLTSAMISIGSIDPIDFLDYTTFPATEGPYYDAVDLDLPIGSVGYVNFEVELPASTPFSKPPSFTGLRSATAFVGQAVYYFDLSTVLTDQF